LNYLQTSSHLQEVLDPASRAGILGWVMHHLKEHIDEFDAIAVSGCSGLLVGPCVADLLQKNIILVRKEGGRTHSEEYVEGPKDGRYIVIDDLTCSGETIRHITSSIKTELCEHSQCVGVVLYHASERRGIWGKDLKKTAWKDVIV